MVMPKDIDLDELPLDYEEDDRIECDNFKAMSRALDINCKKLNANQDITFEELLEELITMHATAGKIAF